MLEDLKKVPVWIWAAVGALLIWFYWKRKTAAKVVVVSVPGATTTTTSDPSLNTGFVPPQATTTQPVQATATIDSTVTATPAGATDDPASLTGSSPAVRKIASSLLTLETPPIYNPPSPSPGTIY
jgi:hypothetical protein